jgi:hypothetical protein
MPRALSVPVTEEEEMEPLNKANKMKEKIIKKSKIEIDPFDNFEAFLARFAIVAMDIDLVEKNANEIR